VKIGDLVRLAENWDASIYVNALSMFECKTFPKGTTGLVIDLEVRGPTPGAFVLFEDETEVRWCPSEYIQIER